MFFKRLPIRSTKWWTVPCWNLSLCNEAIHTCNWNAIRRDKISRMQPGTHASVKSMISWNSEEGMTVNATWCTGIIVIGIISNNTEIDPLGSKGDLTEAHPLTRYLSYPKRDRRVRWTDSIATRCYRAVAPGQYSASPTHPSERFIQSLVTLRLRILLIINLPYN